MAAGEDPKFVPETILPGYLAEQAEHFLQVNASNIAEAADYLGIDLPLGTAGTGRPLSAKQRWVEGVNGLYRIGDNMAERQGSIGADVTHQVQLLVSNTWGEGVISPYMRFLFKPAQTGDQAESSIAVFDAGLRRPSPHGEGSDLLVYGVKAAQLTKMGELAVLGDQAHSRYVVLEWFAGRDVPQNSPFAAAVKESEEFVDKSTLPEHLAAIQAYRRALIKFENQREVRAQPAYDMIRRLNLFGPHFDADYRYRPSPSVLELLRQTSSPNR